MSSTQSNPVQETERQSESAGTLLRQARERRGESLEEVAQALKLSLRQLVAIESGQYDELPGPAFVRGFVRNYARHLGLNPEAVLAAVGADASVAVDLTPLSNAEGDMPATRGLRFNLVPAAIVAALLLALISAGGFLGWFETPPAPEIEAVVPGMPPDVTADDDVPPTEAVGEGSVGSEAGVVVAEPAAVAVVPPQTSAAPGSTPDGASALATEAMPIATEVEAAAQPPSPLRFTFSGESWVEVRDGAGTIVFSGLGVAGSTRSVQGNPPFALVIGNARSVRLEFNGNPVDLVPHTKVSVARLTVK